MIWKTKRRWSGNDSHWGPFTYCKANKNGWKLMLRSGEEEHPGCCLQIDWPTGTLICELPAILPPYREKVHAIGWTPADLERIGRDWYWNEDEREVGFYLFDGHHFVIRFGRSTYDSSTDQMWSCFLPWKEWRHVRSSLYGLDGERFADYPKCWDFEASKKLLAECPRRKFKIMDYDGTEVTVTTRIEEMEWAFGKGWFKWLSWFRKPKISRTLDLDFKPAIGPGKHDWKGGTCGHAIEMRSGELHEAAMRRYCDQDHERKGQKFRLKFIGVIE